MKICLRENYRLKVCIKLYHIYYRSLVAASLFSTYYLYTKIYVVQEVVRKAIINIISGTIINSKATLLKRRSWR
ncbi:MAG: hypothetical protein ACD_57C00014G0005 [uncultured bacterium]|nr:MAG: hypothetical protein ACD_57C00014G0005 [uncultured bacterium]